MPASPSIILHLGLGAFHRAHQAAYLQTLHDLGDDSWTIVSGNIRPDPADAAPALLAQDCAYTLETVDPAGVRAWQLIRAIGRVLPYTPDLAPLLAVGVDAHTRILSCTVTEAGYFLDADGRLDTASPELAAGLADARAGRPGTTLYGVLAALLRARRQCGSGKITLLSCDNLRHNGDRLRGGLSAFIALLGDTGLLDWLDAHASFPNAMVDRITPRPAPELGARVQAATGRIDAVPVMSESFCQWVIEDDFCNGRPAWERAGAELVSSVAPYEEAKIRILNASHSGVAWAGILAGHRYIHEGMRDPRILALVHDYVTQAVFDCLRPSPIDLAAYRDQVIARFSGDAIRDTNERVLADSFAKLPGFIVPTIRERLQRGLAIDSVAPLPALFLAFLLRWHRGGLAVAYRDQAMDPALVARICAAADPVAAFCALPALWDELAGDTRLVDALRRAHARVDASFVTKA